MTASVQQRVPDQPNGSQQLLQFVGRNCQPNGGVSALPCDMEEAGRLRDGEAGHEVFGRQRIADQARASGCSRHDESNLVFCAGPKTRPESLYPERQWIVPDLRNFSFAQRTCSRLAHVISFGVAASKFLCGMLKRPGSRSDLWTRARPQNPDQELAAFRRELAADGIRYLSRENPYVIIAQSQSSPMAGDRGGRTPKAQTPSGVRPLSPAGLGAVGAGTESLR